MKLRFSQGHPRVPNKQRYYRHDSKPPDRVRLTRLFRPRRYRSFENIVAAFRVRHQSHFFALRYPGLAFSALDSIKGQLT
jgi:hypothetical protein